MKKYFLFVFSTFLSFSVFSQAKKNTTAYIFEDYIFENYNGVKKLNEEIEKKKEAFQTEFNKLALEYQNANLVYQQGMQNITSETSETLNANLKKVQGIKEAAENYQRESEKDLQGFIGENITRVKEEIKVATAEAAKSKGVIYTFTRNKGDNAMNPYRVVLFADDSKTTNLSEDVLKILNTKVK
jgi:Skp family chaperone for outer membrane proteins